MIDAILESMILFFSFMDQDKSTSIKVLQAKAQELFPGETVKAYQSSLTIEFKTPIQGFKDLTKDWGPPFDTKILSPPAVSPTHQPLKLDPKDNPYLWATKRYRRQGLVIAFAEHKNHIKRFSLKKS